MLFFFRYIFPWPFVLAGIVTLYSGASQLFEAYRSQSWSVASAKVLYSEVESARRSGKRSSYTVYIPAVRYQFSVNSRDYAGNRIGFWNQENRQWASARQQSLDYPVGQTVPVYYNPKRPEQNVLRPGWNWQLLLLPVFGLVFLGIGSLMVVGLPKLLTPQALGSGHHVR